MVPKRIILHHSAAAINGMQFDKVNQWHKAKDFPKSALNWYVGYHYFIERNGITRQAREETEIGAHDQGENVDSIGICLAGDFNTERPTEAQAAAAAALVRSIRSRHRIHITDIEPHRVDDATDCPGANIPDNWLVYEYLQREANPLFLLFYRIGILLNLI